MNVRIVFMIFVQAFVLTKSYRILGVFPLAGRSHMLMFEKLMKELAKKGHEVDVLTHFPLKKPLPRYNEISLLGTLPILVNNISVEFVRDAMGSDIKLGSFVLNNCGIDLCQIILNTEQAKKLKESDTKYDLLITEIFGTDCMLGFAHHFNIPTINIISSVMLPWGNDRIGNPDNPSYISNYFLHFSSPLNLVQRLINTIDLLKFKVWQHLVSNRETEIAREFFGSDMPPLEELASNVSLILVNSHFSISGVRPVVPNFVEVGGLHIEEPRPLSKHFEEALDLGLKYKGVIYFSMGSLVKTETLPIKILNAFIKALEELPYKVLWKGNKDEFPKDLTIPTNIQIEKWMPQMDILCHPNIKLFITHGGLMGTQEATYCGVPRLGIPLFADQELNLKKSQDQGLAIMVKYDDITEETLKNTLEELLFTERYKTNAEILARLFKDRQSSAVETAIYWVEYVIKYKGAPHLRSPGADLAWYQYVLLDVFLILLTSAILLLLFTVYGVWLLKCKIFKSDNRVANKLKSN